MDKISIEELDKGFKVTYRVPIPKKKGESYQDHDYKEEGFESIGKAMVRFLELVNEHHGTKIKITVPKDGSDIVKKDIVISTI